MECLTRTFGQLRLRRRSTSSGHHSIHASLFRIAYGSGILCTILRGADDGRERSNYAQELLGVSESFPVVRPDALWEGSFSTSWRHSI